jgi:DNA polymerase-3 subunit alpha
MPDLVRHVTCTLDRLPGLKLEPPGPRDRGRPGLTVAVAGMVSGLRTHKNAKGDRMAFVTLADPTGTAECTFFGEAWQQSRAVLQSDRPVLIRGRLEQREGRDEPGIRAEAAEPIADLLSANSREVRLDLRARELDPRRVKGLVGLLASHPGTCECVIDLDYYQRARVRLRSVRGRGVAADDGLRSALESLFGRPDAVRFL